jgi:transcription initiation factor IIF auxiliary subunit
MTEGLTRRITVVKEPPFRIEEEGWGEFFLDVIVTGPDKDHTISHDLNFQENRYEANHVLVGDLCFLDPSTLMHIHQTALWDQIRS